MASEILVNLHEDLTCPLCLELMRDPLSLDCGHSFCQACIIMNNKASMTSSEGENSCPVCRSIYRSDNLRPNWHLAKVVERLKKVKVEEGQKTDVCERHGEKLLLFCQKDEMVICWLCERSQEHKGHQTFLVEEVVQHYQANFKAALKRLRMQQKEAEKFGDDIREERAFWKNQMQTERERIQQKFDQLRHVLDHEEEEELQKLQKEEEDIMCQLTEDDNELAQKSQLIAELIGDLERRFQVSSVEMLQDVKGIIKRSVELTVKRSKTFLNEQRKGSQAVDLRGIVQAFKALRVNMELTPVNSPSDVVISKDGKQARLVEKPTPSHHSGNISGNPGNFLFSFAHTGHQRNKGNVLSSSSLKDVNIGHNPFCGSLRINSGKHYWEVDISGKTVLILGVCRVARTEVETEFDFNQSGLQNVYSKYLPTYGYWVIGLQSQYITFENASSSKPQNLITCQTFPPCGVGVFIDCESRTVSFFNVTNHGSLIYKFSNCCFSTTVCPYFNLKECANPMSLCSPGS
ncbi:PREDICTED: tripartite motif-containing protein 5-like [Chrysochloris asiatica]|uniref:Tripartite motif-containing protein 5-like n=1 Tax=Chrysochloris asiatica TaxID=185453 RepID=A0A9B0WWD0_CHRAS|nr:PREDICTED: tripartite motif-containing protein 5-like [Chrysochloris asiatica]